MFSCDKAKILKEMGGGDESARKMKQDKVQVVLVVKNLPPNAGDSRITGSIPE